MRIGFFLMVFLLVAVTSVLALESYIIEAAINDELFIINGEKYEAKTYCLGWQSGESVVFLEGSSLGACVSAELYNMNRKEKCEVWCE